MYIELTETTKHTIKIKEHRNLKKKVPILLGND